MPTSGTYNWTLTKLQIISSALRKIGAIAYGENATTEQISIASDYLNAIAQEWQARGVRLWTKNIKICNNNNATVVTGTDLEKYFCYRSHLSSNDNKPITGSVYSAYWKKYSGSLTSVSWQANQNYTCSGEINTDDHVIDVENISIREIESDKLLQRISDDDYFSIPNKAEIGSPNYYYIKYTRKNPIIYLYPQPETKYTFILNQIIRLEDFSNNNDEPDFPVKWIRPLIYALAHDLSHDYGMPLEERVLLAKDAERFFMDAKNSENECLSNSFIHGAYDA